MNLRHDDPDALDPALLVRHLHGELDAETARALSAHMATCGACRSRSDALAWSVRRMSDALRCADHPAPEREAWQAVLGAARAAGARRGQAARPSLAAAAVLAVVTAGALAAAPVRDWVTERWDRLFGTAPAANAAATTRMEDRARVAFAVAGTELEVALATTQSAGTLDVRFTGSATASVAVTGGGTDRVTVGASAVHIANDAASAASWQLAVPSGVERVTVRIGTLDAIALARDDGAGQVRIALDSGRPVRNPAARDEP